MYILTSSGADFMSETLMTLRSLVTLTLCSGTTQNATAE